MDGTRPESKLDRIIALLITERHASDQPITLTEAVERLCSFMGVREPADLYGPSAREEVGDFPDFAVRHYLWSRLRGKSASVVEDILEDAEDRVIGRLQDRWNDGDRVAYSPDVVAVTLGEELGRRATPTELRDLISRAKDEWEIDEDTAAVLDASVDLIRERADRGVPGLVVGDVVSDALNRVFEQRREP